MNYPVVDFRKPGRIPEDIGQMLAQWQRVAREAVEVRLSRFIPSGPQVSVVSPEPVTGADLRTGAADSIVYRVDIAETNAVTLLMIDRSLALALAAEMLGAPPEALPDARKPTAIETICLDFLVEELKGLIVASQKFTPARNLKVVGIAELKELHSEFPANTTNSTFGFNLELPYGTGGIRWILPQAVTLDMVASSPKTIQSNGHAREDLKRSVLNAPSEISVSLGGAQVLLSKLSSLAVGEIIVLDQKIDEPLTAKVGGQPMFLGWCGQSGKQQMFQIDELFDLDAA